MVIDNCRGGGVDRGVTLTRRPRGQGRLVSGNTPFNPTPARGGGEASEALMNKMDWIVSAGIIAATAVVILLDLFRLTWPLQRRR